SAGEEHYDELKRKIMDVIGDYFRPEFLNRIDETVIFHSLEKTHVKQIAAIQLAKLVGRLKENGIQFEFSDSALSNISDKGFDPVYGARPLKRAIQQWIENTLAEKILSGQVEPKSTIVLDVVNGELVFKS
ncbi:MAG: type VI secretion system ATPase TssH, partial [Kangiellaceae bacterium]|nr:type VI secretion system ATPase TssH [Kangiellaceae bacterium]